LARLKTSLLIFSKIAEKKMAGIKKLETYPKIKIKYCIFDKMGVC